MATAAMLLGVALHWSRGFYRPSALLLVSVAMLIVAAVSLLTPPRIAERFASTGGVALVAIGVLVESELMFRDTDAFAGAALVAGTLSVLQVFDLGRLRWPLFGAAVAVFCVVAAQHIRVDLPAPPIDVFMFQQRGVPTLLQGTNPFLPTYPNIYGPNSPFYGRGVVDQANHLTFGFPYPPLSLLMVVPGYLFGGDARFMDIAAVAGTAVLIAASVPSRWGMLVSALFLLTPRAVYVIGQSWTDALFALTFSLVMFAALRWRRALPYALGLFVATKQYSIVVLPLVALLTTSNDRWKETAGLLVKAGLVAAVITLPFFLWGPATFWRSVVMTHVLQPFRMDALTHQVWMRARLPGLEPLISVLPYVGLVATTGLVLWRGVRSPASFATAVTLVFLTFFAFGKQAFANYYYLTIATAAWAAAASAPADARL